MYVDAILEIILGRHVQFMSRSTMLIITQDNTINFVNPRQKKIKETKTINTHKIQSGDICRNSSDVIGIVLRYSNISCMYSGITLDGELWTGVKPTFIAHSVNEYLSMNQDQK